MNSPPFFSEGLIKEIKMESNDLTINLPNIEDDRQQFYSLQLFSETLGAPYEFKNLDLLQKINETSKDNIKKLKSQNKEEILTYNRETNKIRVSIKDR